MNSLSTNGCSVSGQVGLGGAGQEPLGVRGVESDGMLIRTCQAGVMDRQAPHPVADERTMLDQFLDYQRATLLLKTAGLNQEQLNRRLSTSALTLGGLLKHLALVEDDWIHVRFCGRSELEPWASAPWDQDRDWEFHTAERDDPAWH